MYYWLVVILTAFFASLMICKRNGEVSQGKSLKVSLFVFVGVFLVVNGWMFLVTPAITGVLGGLFRIAVLPVLLVAVARLVVRKYFDGYDGFDADTILQITKIAVVLALGIYLAVAPGTLLNGDLYKIPQVEESNQENLTNSNFAPVDPQHMRVVNQSMAYTIGSREISNGTSKNLGSMYQVGVEDFSIQNVKDQNGVEKLYWVAPLQYQGIGQWKNIGYSPGFIMVDAENPYASAQLHLGFEMRYLTSAYYKDDVIRHLYFSGYTNFGLEDINFEVTDDLQPRWVVSLTYPTVLNTGKVVKGVAIVDPETGAIEEYDITEVPEWVDRVIPESLALDYLRWKGAYTHGFWNLVPWIGTNKDYNIPCTINGEEEMWLVHGKDNHGYWFTGMTSHSSADQALVANVMVDSRTGRMHIYEMSGWNEQAVIDAVNHADSVKNNQWQGCAPIPYDFLGSLAYVVTVVADTGNGVIFKKIAIVDAGSGNVALGNNRVEAYEAHRQFLSKSKFGGVVSESSVSSNMRGTVGRISDVSSGEEGNYRVFQLNGSDAIFEVGTTPYPEAELTMSGDMVRIFFGETGEQVLAVTAFDNLDIDSRTAAVNKTD